jgi:hypothetical protein
VPSWLTGWKIRHLSLGARILVAVGTSLVVSFLLLFVAGNGYDARIPAPAVPALVTVIVVGASSLSAVAYALSTIIRSSTAVQPVIALVAVPLYLISGMFSPRRDCPPSSTGQRRCFRSSTSLTACTRP